MATQEVTTMGNLIGDIKDTYLTYRSTKGTNLNKIATFKKGILGQSVVYPAIVVFPISEIILQRRSNHCQVVGRTVRTEIYHRSHSPRASNEKIMDDEEAIRNIWFDSSYPNNYKFTTSSVDRCFDFEMGSFSFDVVDDQLLQVVSVDIMFKSLEYPSSYTIETQIEEETKDILTTISTNLENNVSNVSFFYNTALPPISLSGGSAICIREIEAQDQHTWLGRDEEVREYHIYLWSKLSTYEENYIAHLIKADDIKDTLHENMMIGGRSYYSKIRGLNHGINGTMMLYGTQIIYETRTFRNLPTY